MGIDFLDVIFRIEKTFDVKVSVDELFALTKDDEDILVGDLYVHILQKLRLRDIARYDVRLNLALWRDLQNKIHTITEVPLDRIELKTPLEELFPPKSRHVTWESLRKACPYHFPKLEYPILVSLVGVALTLTMVGVEQFQLWQVPGLKWLWPILGLFGIWMFVETHAKVMWLLTSVRTRFPAGICTIKDLCRAVLATNYVDFLHVDTNDEIPFDEDCLEVWQQLNNILVESLGIDPDQITLNSRMIRDLGMG